MTRIDLLMYGTPILLVGLMVGLAWGSYRGYVDALKALTGLAEIAEKRLEAGDLVLTALKKGEKVTVITGEGKSVTNLWLKDPENLKPEDWDRIEQTTRQVRKRAETKANKRST